LPVVFRGDGPASAFGPVQSPGHPVPDEVVDPTLVGEADFVLGGVDIDIHLVERQVQKQNGEGKLPLHQPAAVAFEKGVLNHPVPHPAPVHIEVDPPGGAAGQPRRPQVSGQPDLPRLLRQGDQFAARQAPQDIGHPPCRVVGTGPLANGPAVVGKLEVDPGIPQGHAGDGIADVAHLGVDGLEEFAPGGGVVK
jgi:hypothetical protein